MSRRTGEEDRDELSEETCGDDGSGPSQPVLAPSSLDHVTQLSLAPMVVLTVAVGTRLAGGLQAVVNVDPFSWFSSRPETRWISWGVNAARSSSSWLVSVR